MLIVGAGFIGVEWATELVPRQPLAVCGGGSVKQVGKAIYIILVYLYLYKWKESSAVSEDLFQTRKFWYIMV